MWREVKRIIDQHHHFMLTTHSHPDGDGIGSSCALTELLLLKGKSVRFVCDSPMPEKFRFLDYHGCFEQYEPSISYDEAEVLIVLDAHRRDRIDRLSALCERADLVTVCVDHHQARAPEFQHTVIDPHACSVGAMLYTLYKECGFDLNLRAATGIYTSILCDTGRFSYASTTRKAHKIADECIKLGVDPDLMYSRLFEQLSLPQLQLFALALKGMGLYYNNSVLIQELHHEDCKNVGLDPAELENLDLDYILEFDKLVSDVVCVILLREIDPLTVRVSVRSKADLNIKPLLQELGGGGHRCAAGALFHGTVASVKDKLLEGLAPQIEAVHCSSSQHSR